jgi:23S rRNA pseudouridine1911/1915/1917 synthase
MKILFEDNHLLVVEKPINVPMQADDSKDLDLLSMGKAYLKEKYQKPGNVYLGLVHRLDRPVGGVVVFAKTSKAAGRLSESIRTDQLIKTYEALLEGPLPKAAVLTDYLIKDEKTNTSRVTDAKHGKYCELSWELLSSDGQRNHVRIHLKTGRSHQIRVQFASRGCPLFGDQRYNRNANVGQQLALWAVELRLPHPITHEVLTFDSPSPFKI